MVEFNLDPGEMFLYYCAVDDSKYIERLHNIDSNNDLTTPQLMRKNMHCFNERDGIVATLFSSPIQENNNTTSNYNNRSINNINNNYNEDNNTNCSSSSSGNDYNTAIPISTQMYSPINQAQADTIKGTSYTQAPNTLNTNTQAPNTPNTNTQALNTNTQAPRAISPILCSPRSTTPTLTLNEGDNMYVY
jgi:hypothetical protein